MCDTTHSHVWHDSFTNVASLIHTCNDTDPFRLYAWHESCHNVNESCDRTHSHYDRTHSHWHHSFTHVTTLIDFCTNIAPTTFGSCMHRYCSQCQKLIDFFWFVHTNTVIAPKYQRMMLCFWVNVFTDIAPNAKDSFLASLRLAKIGVNTSEVFPLLRGDTNQ